MTACLIYKAKGWCPVAPLWKALRWLPIEKCIEENVLTSAFKDRNVLHRYIWRFAPLSGRAA